jgi:hypothetical protein
VRDHRLEVVEGCNRQTGHGGAHLCWVGVDERNHRETPLGETLEGGERSSQVAGTDDDDPVFVIEAEQAGDLPAQVVDVVADPADPPQADEGEVLSHLSGLDSSDLGELL